MEQLKDFLNSRKKTETLRRLVPLVRLGRGRIRLAAEPDSPVLLDFSSNDYLALTEHPAVITASRKYLEKIGAGAGAARLMSGDLDLHHQLESKVAELKGKEAALIFGSGYLANAGVIPALVGRGDAIFSDRLNHASIYDGCRLAGARLFRFHHNDLDHLEKLLRENRAGFRRAIIVVESLYSMDGDRCPLNDLVALKKRHDCLLMVDEAHATGIFGENGGGVIEEDGVGPDVDIAMGTFGKALGSYGAYIASSRDMALYLVNRARTFIYSTALPPAVIGASLAALDIIRTEPSLRRELRANVNIFQDRLLQEGLIEKAGPSQIVPVIIGPSSRAVEIAGRLREKGVYATAVRPPTVPEGTARLRFSITRHHTHADLEETVRALMQTIIPK